jgi:hypothetical protein
VIIEEKKGEDEDSLLNENKIIDSNILDANEIAGINKEIEEIEK